MIKLKRIIEQGEFAAQIAKSNAKMDALMARQPLSVKSDRLGPTGEYQPLANLKPLDKSSTTSSAQSQVKQIFDKAKSMPSSIEDWNSIKSIADAMHTALSGMGSGDFLEQLKKIKSLAQFSALVKNWVYDGQTLYQWLEEEYTLEWQEILDIIKPLQTVVGKYTRGLFDTIYDDLKSKGWKISTSNVLDTDFMYKGMWIIRRNSADITYGNKSTGIVTFTIKNYSNLNSIESLTTGFFESELLIGQLGNKLYTSTPYTATKTLKEWERILLGSKDVYIYFLSKKYKSIVEQHFHKLLSKTYDNARKWWINKLSDPEFARIYSRVNGISRNETKKIIEEYKRIILSISIETQFFGESTEYSGVYRPSGNFIQIVCDLLKAYYAQDALYDNVDFLRNKKLLADILSTTVHELQHAIWAHQPLNKTKTWEQIQPYDINVGGRFEREWYKVFGANAAAVLPNEKQLSTISSLYKIPKTKLDDWVIETKNVKSSKGFYPCNINEHQSRLSQYKLENGLSTSAPIRTKDMISAVQMGPSDIRDTNLSMWYYIIICWTRNSMTDINSFIGWLNTNLLVKRDTNKSNKNTGKDFTQTA